MYIQKKIRLVIIPISIVVIMLACLYLYHVIYQNTKHFSRATGNITQYNATLVAKSVHNAGGEHEDHQRVETPLNKMNNTVNFSSQAFECDKINLNQLAPFMKSQSGEDKLLLQWFNGMCNGTYLEMGALDGLEYSNSYVFNKKFNWKGVMIELDPSNFKRLQINRPDELATVHAAVCTKQQTVHLVQNHGAVSGIWEFANEKFRKGWWKNVKMEEMIPIECSPLAAILKKVVGDSFYFDFFSLDVEGAEYEVVISLNFSAVQFGVILVESDGGNIAQSKKIRDVLVRNGYKYMGQVATNMWFVNSNMQEIYRYAIRKQDQQQRDLFESAAFQPNMNPRI